MDGIVIINKEKGCTSHDVVHKIKKIVGEKVGHTGTLDPNATGVLPILVGKGTELSQFLINHDKKYIATLKLGIKTDTADSEGKIIDEKNVDELNLTESNLNNVFESMLGKQKQVPPMYSAIKINGKKLYEYARRGQHVDIPEREIEIYSLNLIGIDTVEHIIEFEIYCSKGTYIRTVCEKIAEKLNTVGYMKELKRTMVGNFTLKEAITINDLSENIANENYLNEKILTIEKFFENRPKVNLENKKLKMFLNGVLIESEYFDGVVKVYDSLNRFIGIGICENNKLKRKIILNN